MTLLTISGVARQTGLRPSAIRYYEKVGILTPPQRVGGKRNYDSTVFYRLAVVLRARQLGFSLDEIRVLFSGFRDVTPTSARWRDLSLFKLRELQLQAAEIRTMQGMLRRMMDRCDCESLEQCGKKIFQNMCGSRDDGCGAKGSTKTVKRKIPRSKARVISEAKK